MESIVLDQSAARSRTSAFSGMAIDVGRSRGHGGLSRARSSSSAYYSLSSLNNLVAELAGSGNFGSFGPRPPPPPLPNYSSLPPFSPPIAYVSPPPQPPYFGPLHPPLLPLPPLLAATIPPPGKRTASSWYNTNFGNGRSRDQRNKTKAPAAGRRKDVQPSSVTPAEVLKKLAAETPSAAPGEDKAAESVYLLSPSPSSLPLPSFALLRARSATTAGAG